jgi:hypothetical protein
MKIRQLWIGFFLTDCTLLLAWAARPGEPAPDLALRDCRGVEVRLSAYRQKKQVAVLVQAPGASQVPEVLDETCRRLEALDTVVLFMASDADANREFLENVSAATVLIDSGGVVRRVLPGRTLTGPDLANFVKLWLNGKGVFSARCARCHGEDGDSTICLDVKPLVGIGTRMTEAQIRERLHPGELNDRELLIRGEFYSRPDVEAVIVYVAGL